MWFKQEAATNGLSVALPSGHRVSLDLIDDETLDGYLATLNGFVVNQIRSAIAERRGGWLEISEGAYNEAVKKKAQPPSRKANLRRLNAGMFQPRVNRSEDAAFAEVGARPDPIAVPTKEQMKLPPRPRVGKMTA
jgi:hypothetical protein